MSDPDNTVTHIHKNEGPEYLDSIEIGTPGKGGAVKVYFNAGDLDDARRRVRIAFEVREMAQRLAGV